MSKKEVRRMYMAIKDFQHMYLPCFSDPDKELIKELEKKDFDDLYKFSKNNGYNTINFYLFMRGILRKFLDFDDESGTEGYEKMSEEEARENFRSLTKHELARFMADPYIQFHLPTWKK